jgi:hypothetical protein
MGTDSLIHSLVLAVCQAQGVNRTDKLPSLMQLGFRGTHTHTGEAQSIAPAVSASWPDEGHIPDLPTLQIYVRWSNSVEVRQARLGGVWDCSLFWLKSSFPLAHRSEEPGDDVLSPHLQVQGCIKMTYQKTLALSFFSSLTWQNGWLPFP